MSDDWETNDFEIKKADEIEFQDEKLKIAEKPIQPVVVQSQPQNPPKDKKKEVKKEIHPDSIPCDDPVKEKDRIAR